MYTPTSNSTSTTCFEVLGGKKPQNNPNIKHLSMSVKEFTYFRNIWNETGNVFSFFSSVWDSPDTVQVY